MRRAFVFLLPFLVSCAPLVSNDAPLHLDDWRAIAARDPMGDTENIHVTPIDRGRLSSTALVRIRFGERPHIHATHDITVFFLDGSGEMTIGDAARPARAGDVVRVPRGVPHFFTNRGEAPAAGFVVFTPPYDGKDNIPLGDH